jgi:hypothetical protein
MTSHRRYTLSVAANQRRTPPSSVYGKTRPSLLGLFSVVTRSLLAKWHIVIRMDNHGVSACSLSVAKRIKVRNYERVEAGHETPGGWEAFFLFFYKIKNSKWNIIWYICLNYKWFSLFSPYDEMFNTRSHVDRFQWFLWTSMFVLHVAVFLCTLFYVYMYLFLCVVVTWLHFMCTCTLCLSVFVLCVFCTCILSFFVLPPTHNSFH